MHCVLLITYLIIKPVCSKQEIHQVNFVRRGSCFQNARLYCFVPAKNSFFICFALHSNESYIIDVETHVYIQIVEPVDENRMYIKYLPFVDEFT